MPANRPVCTASIVRTLATLAALAILATPPAAWASHAEQETDCDQHQAEEDGAYAEEDERTTIEDESDHDFLDPEVEIPLSILRPTRPAPCP